MSLESILFQPCLSDHQKYQTISMFTIKIMTFVEWLCFFKDTSSTYLYNFECVFFIHKIRIQDLC